MLVTVSDLIRDEGETLLQRLSNLLLTHASLYRWNEAGILPSNNGDYAWRDLEPEGMRLQSQLLEDYNRFSTILSILLQGQPRDLLKTYEGHARAIRKMIRQDKVTWHETAGGALEEIREALLSQVTMVGKLYHGSEEPHIYIPDTNALLLNPQLERWRFSDSARFTLTLLPTVLAELDALKSFRPNDDVGKKADEVIRLIKSYRAQENLVGGVTLKPGVSSINAVSSEPKSRCLFPWLDLNSRNDRIIASSVEVIRQYPHRPIMLVTGDICLQTKLSFAKLPFVESIE